MTRKGESGMDFTTSLVLILFVALIVITVITQALPLANGEDFIENLVGQNTHFISQMFELGGGGGS